MTTEQLNERLERERRKVLRDLGVENVDDAKTALAAFKAKQEADKTEAQRNAEKLAELDRVKADAAALRETVSMRAASEMATLTDEQRDAVKVIAGDDSAAQLRAITALSKTWATKPAPVAATAPAPAAPPAATTAPPPTAPTGSSAGSPPDHKAEYARLKATNPVAAAHYLVRYERQIYT